MNDLLNILIVTMMTTREKNEENLFKVNYSISSYLLDYFSWLSKQNHNFNSMVAGQLYPGIFEVGNKFTENKNILNEGGSLLFFIYCKNAIDQGFCLPILQKVSGLSEDENEINYDFTTMKNKDQATALLALECYIFGKILHNDSKFGSDKDHIEKCLKSLMESSLECLKNHPDFIDLDTYYQSIRMIENQFRIEKKKINLLHKDYMTFFFYFILADLALNTNNKTFEQLLDNLIIEAKVSEEDNLEEAFALLIHLLRDDSEEQVDQQVDTYVNFVLDEKRKFYQNKCIEDIKKYNELYDKLMRKDLIKKIEKDLKQFVTDKFNIIIVEDSKKANLTSSTISFPVDDLNSESIVNYYNENAKYDAKEKVVKLFFEELCRSLIDKGKAVESSIEKYQNNDQLIKNYHLLIGANILTTLSLNKDKIENFNQMYDVINIRFSKDNLLLPNKEFKIIIKNIEVQLTGKSIAEMNISPDAKGQYQCSSINDGNETINYYWSEEEMKSIANYYKKAVVKFEIEIALPKNYKQGIVLKNR